jgi:2-dehydro-3-deoxyphosphogluconate aldolase / (4S)-4-hydroxy-2-oxoglutarate aldolase
MHALSSDATRCTHGAMRHSDSEVRLTSFIETLEAAPILPLIEADDTRTAIAIARALHAGGLSIVEVVQRTDRSLDCLAAIARHLPALVTGAGTVLSAAQAEACLDAGAKFIVSPGLDDGIVEIARSRNVDVVPGVMTPTELQHAGNLGLEVVKFFPAATAGGTAALGALAAVFRRIRFIPTGGISAANLAAYLSLDCVLACGGSWMTPRDAVARGDFARLTAAAAEALLISKSARGVNEP